MTVYPPYQTEAFQRCPMLYDLGRRWMKREPQPTTARLIGIAVAAGLEAHFNGQGDCLEIAHQVVRAGYLEGSDRSFDGVAKLVSKGVRLGKSTNLGYESILAVEKSFARCRPDLVVRMLDGRIAIVDHKVKIQLDPKYLSAECRRFNTSTQFLHYSMAVGEYFGEHVDTVVPHLIILGPRGMTVPHPVKVTKERLAYWRKGAERAWREMHLVESGQSELVPNFTSCETRYGVCDFYAACHNLDCDPSRMEVVYDAV